MLVRLNLQNNSQPLNLSASQPISLLAPQPPSPSASQSLSLLASQPLSLPASQPPSPSAFQPFSLPVPQLYQYCYSLQGQQRMLVRLNLINNSQPPSLLKYSFLKSARKYYVTSLFTLLQTQFLSDFLAGVRRSTLGRSLVDTCLPSNVFT